MCKWFNKKTPIILLSVLFLSVSLVLNGCGSSGGGKKHSSGDTTPPSSITNLAVSGETTSSVVLAWIAPGDDGTIGTASGYDIRYSKTESDVTNWVNAVTLEGVPSPLAAGTNQQFTVTGLICGITYYFAVKTSDEIPNTSSISNLVTTKTTACPDLNAPENSTASNFINGGATYTKSPNVSLAISANDSDGVAAYFISESPVTPTASDTGWIGITSAPAFSEEVQYTLSNANGSKDVYVWFKDAAGNVSASRSDSILLDSSAPAIPTGLNVQVINKNQMDVSWSAPADAGDITTYNIYRDGILIGVSDSASFSDKTVIPGKKHIYTITANDKAGNESDKSSAMDGIASLLVAVNSPYNLITVSSSPITVKGSVNDSTAAVTVNGVAAVVADSKFEVQGITISEGMNTIAVRALDKDNMVATANINISLDSTPPHVAITSPPDGYKTSSSTITVTGIINDIVRGTVNESQGKVLVNGAEAVISNRNFIVENVPLVLGANTITASGSDQWGNTKDTSITVNLDTTQRKTLTIESGNNQSSLIGTMLPNPLVVSLREENDAPVNGEPVIFRVAENNGVIQDSLSGSVVRAVAVNTDAEGHAQADFRVGTWAGSGNNRVEVTASGVDGNVIFIASGTQKPPAAIYVAQGNQQRGGVNQPLPEPLVAFVTDEGHNPLDNVPVIFRAMEGGGLFSNGLDNITRKTDSDGRAAVSFILGPEAGNDSNVIEATFEGNTNPPAGFTATSLIPGEPGDTKVSGVVLDNSNNPIINVTVRVEGTTRDAVTDSNGQFTVTNVPVGPIHLIADGTTAGIPGVLEYPTLMYELTTVAGANNSVGMPIYLVPLDLVNSKVVGGSADVIYTIPEVPGFELTVKANSVTFPNGDRQGRISVTQVHADKVPMVPQIGQQPRFIVTIQPPGTVFDPPAPLKIPNVDGLSPGEKTNMYSFDHDLGIFVSIGTGTVSEDGTLIVSDPGVGVVKAGWHCGGNPAPTGSANVCPDCQKCDGTKCVADASNNGQRCEDTKSNFEIACGTGTVKVDIDPSCKGKCKDGSCKDDPFGINQAKAAITSAVANFCGTCIDNANGLRDKIQKFIKDNGFKITCNASGTDCASAAPGSNTFELTPNALDVAKCDALDSSTLHEMVHAAASFRHRKCKADGTVLGEISCASGADCQVCVDPDTDKSYGCEAACYPTTGSKVGKASACK